jgi:dTDP-glucose pyrophosphorylase
MIKKAIILAGGKGTRLMPLTQAMPKEMLRVGLKPVIEHVVSALKSGGLDQILVIVGRKKESIIDHLGSGARLKVDIYYKIQDEPKGTAHAVFQGRNFIDTDDFVVIYGDNYFKPFTFVQKILDFHVSNKAEATLATYPVSDPERYGIVKLNKAGLILEMIEKPTYEEAKSYLVGGKYQAIAGLLVFNNEVFKYIEKTKIGKNKEYWLTDTVELMRRDGKKIMGYTLQGKRYDVGTFESLIEADRFELESNR